MYDVRNLKLWAYVRSSSPRPEVLIQQMNAARQARRDRMPGIPPPDKLTKIQKKIWM